MGQEKECIYCERVLPLENFHIRKDNGRHVGACKQCRAARSKRYYRENTKSHHESVKRRYETFGRFLRYGISVEQYDEALSNQGNCCALCKSPKPGGKGKWHIDHRHAEPTRAGFNQTEDGTLFRGVLCHKCNISLGHYEKLLGRVGREAVEKYLA